MNFLSNKQKVVTFNVKSNKTNNLWTKKTCFDAAAAQEQNFNVCQMHLRSQRANKDGTTLHPDTFCHSPAFRTKKKHYKCSSFYIKELLLACGYCSAIHSHYVSPNCAISLPQSQSVRTVHIGASTFLVLYMRASQHVQ